jgi:hypothetical protein
VTEPVNERMQEEIAKATELFRKKYDSDSEISKIVNTRDATDNDRNFLQLGSKYYIPKDWFTRDDIFYDIAIEQFAESLIISETKYILTRLIDCREIHRVIAQENILNTFIEQFRQFSETSKVQVIFAPIDLYVKMHIEWPVASTDVQLDLRSGQLSICGEKPKIFWSNKYTPFNDFILLNKSLGEWISSPSFDNRLLVSILPSDRDDQMGLSYSTKMKFELTKPQKGIIISRNMQ